MSDIYREAVLDAKRLREVAYQNARDTLVENITPKLKQMIENRLMLEDDASLPVPTKDDSNDDVLLDLAGNAPVALNVSEPAGISLPDDEGKVTLDLDSFVVPSETNDSQMNDSVELTAEAVKALADMLASKKNKTSLEENVKKLETDVNVAISEGSAATKHKNKKILQRVMNTYFSVRESKSISEDDKKRLGSMLERMHKSLVESGLSEADLDLALENVSCDEEDHDTEVDEMKENDVYANENDELDEAELKLTVTGLPDEVQPEEVNVSVDAGDELVDDGDADDVLADDGENLELSDDDVVEISESMLRQELSRMRQRARRRLQEDDAPGPDEFDDFGDATKEADPEDVTMNKNESVRRAAFAKRLRERRVARLAERRSVRENAHLKAQVAHLTKKLAESNLFNAKLVYANKLMQRNLSDKQKVHIVESLDSARSVGEVRRLYKSLSSRLSAKLTESATGNRVIGSASRPVRPGSTVVTESVEHEQVDRWATLAGICK